MDQVLILVVHLVLLHPSVNMNEGNNYLKPTLFVTVAMLSLYKSPVNCRRREAASKFTHKVNYHYY